MGSSTASVSQPQTSGSSGKMGPIGQIVSQSVNQAPAPQPVQSSGKGGRITYPASSGQPQMGQPNPYSNTVGPWDNASIMPRQTQSGKGKGY